MNNKTATDTTTGETYKMSGATAPSATSRKAAHVTDRVLDFISSWWPPLLRKEVAYQKTALTNLHADWAEDHTHLQDLCRAAGATEFDVEGGSYGVPDIIELSDLLRNTLSKKIVVKEAVAPSPTCKKAKTKRSKKEVKPTKIIESQ